MNPRRHPPRLWLLALSLGSASFAAVAQPATASFRGCSAATTSGNWMYTCEGTLPAPEQTGARVLGTCSASRAGFFSCTGTVNLGGGIVTQGLNGQANTLPNCTGTISYAQTLGGAYVGQLDINYVVTDRGGSINGLPTNSGGVLSCSLKRID